MKKLVSMILVVCLICSTCIVPVAVDVNEASIKSPGNGDWIDPYKTTTVTWSTPSSGMNYKVTIKNDRTGKYIVKNESVSGNSYSIKSNVLDFEERYVIWVGTYDGGSALGHGDSIVVYTNDRYSSQKVYEEAEISYPSNGQEVSADEDLTITLDGDHDLAYLLTVKDTTSGKIIVNESGLTKTSYTVRKNLLTEGHSYKVWVGTYKKASAEKKQFGSGKEITFKTGTKAVNEPPKRPVVDNSEDSDRPVVDVTDSTERPDRPVVDTEDESPKYYEAAEILAPSNGEWLDPTERIRIRWSDNSPDLEYCLSVRNDVTGEYIVKNEYTGNSSYSIGAYELEEQQRYKITLETYSDDGLVGRDEVYMNTNDVDYQEAEFSYPADGDNVVASKKLTVKFSGMNSALCYRISIVDCETGESIVRNKMISGSTYSLSANSLEAGKQYKLWVGTYLNSGASDAVGPGRVIYITATEEKTASATVEAVFTAPANNATVNRKKDLTLKWEKSDIDTYYELTVKDLTDESYLTQNELVTGTSYQIKASKLKEGHEYKAWIGTYSDKSAKKRFIGSGDILYFRADGTTPVLIRSLTADVDERGLVFKYQMSGDASGYATILVKDSKGKTIYNEKEYDLSGEVVIALSALEQNMTYICEIQAYSANGQKAAYKSQEYTVAKSGFSVDKVEKPVGELNYEKTRTKGFTVKGVVGSAYPIAEAKIVIFVKGDESKIQDIVHLKNYHQTAENPNQFNIYTYDSEVNFGSVLPGDYTYQVSVVDTMGKRYVAVESHFSIVREKGTYDDVPSNHKNYEAIKKLSLDGIISGDGNGKFRPNASITRAEFVKMLYFAFKLSPVTTRDLRSGFSDVDTKHWAYTYIISAFNKGIINGKGNGKFAPNDPVTFAEAAKMLVCIKGWQDTAEQNGGWSGGGYTMVAEKNGFFQTTSAANGNYKRNASRADVAQMFYNTLNKSTNDVVKADKIYTINGVSLYAYKYTSGYYVDTAKALPALGGYDIKSENNKLKGKIQIWDVNIAHGGKSLKVDYDFTGKHNGDYQELNIQLTQNNLSLEYSIYKKYFKKNKIQLTCKDDMTLINVDDLAMLTNHMIKDAEFCQDPRRDVFFAVDTYYSKDIIVQNAQLIYDGIESLGGKQRLNQSISLYNEWYKGALEAYEKSNDINKVYNAVGYLTTTTITVASICTGNVTGVGQIAYNVAPGITLDIAANKIEEVCDTEQGVVCFLLANTDKDTYKKFADFHTSIDRDTMTKEQAIEYITKYYEAEINAETITMAFSYFANKCPENFPQALFGSAKAAFGSIVSSVLGKIYDDSGAAKILSYDVANFFFGTSLSLLDTLKVCDNEIVSNWANSVLSLKNALNEALYGSK